jgi:nucleotide sugar dehydrogenase
MKAKIGFIGQGWIGKNYADDFEERGYGVVRYDNNGFEKNKNLIKDCEIVFIAVPTPTTKKGFDYSIVEKVLSLIGKGRIAVIKSTILPGTGEKLQKKFKDIFVFHSPEFLMEATAHHDARNPNRNIVGVCNLDKKTIEAAKKVLKVLPKSPYEKIMLMREAEMVKYIGNCFLYTKVVFFNTMFDLMKKQKLDYDSVMSAVAEDPRIGPSHMTVVHNSGHTRRLGRGAGGHCFIKDFDAMLLMHKKYLGEDRGYKALKGYREKNNELLVKSKKDLELLQGCGRGYFKV